MKLSFIRPSLSVTVNAYVSQTPHLLTQALLGTLCFFVAKTKIADDCIWVLFSDFGKTLDLTQLFSQ